VAVNDVEKYAVLCEEIESIANIIVYYHVLDSTIPKHNKDTQIGYEKAVVELYRLSLTYLAKAKRYFSYSKSLLVLNLDYC